MTEVSPKKARNNRMREKNQLLIKTLQSEHYKEPIDFNQLKLLSAGCLQKDFFVLLSEL